MTGNKKVSIELPKNARIVIENDDYEDDLDGVEERDEAEGGEDEEDEAAAKAKRRGR